MLKLYGFSKVNALARGHTRDLRVLWALEELQLPFELVGLDHPAHALGTDAYRRLSPFEQIPSIDDDGVALSESAAIVLYLAKKAGRLIPADRAGEAQVMRWCFAAMSTVEPPLQSLMVLDWTADGQCGKTRAFLVIGGTPIYATAAPLIERADHRGPATVLLAARRTGAFSSRERGSGLAASGARNCGLAPVFGRPRCALAAPLSTAALLLFIPQRGCGSISNAADVRAFAGVAQRF